MRDTDRILDQLRTTGQIVMLRKVSRQKPATPVVVLAPISDRPVVRRILRHLGPRVRRGCRPPRETS